MMFYYLITALCLAAVALGDHARLHLRDSCNNGYTQCSPQGAAATDAPAIGSSLSGLYVDLLDSINKVQKVKRDDNHQLNLEIRASGGAVCCADGTNCLLLQNYELPFCYDKFTTNYFLPGGAYGQVVSGNYTTSGGQANLLTGNYTLNDGTSGTISQPNTATLTLPTQYTASGVGSAIPVSALGEWTTYTTTIPGSTIPATTDPAHVIPASIVSGSTVAPATTEPAMTLAATTVQPITSVLTTRVAQATSSPKSASGTMGKKGALSSGSVLLVSFLTFLALL